MSGADFQVILAAGLILLMVLAPIYAWQDTRKLTLPVFGFYVLFLLINSDFVFGILGTGHDVVWNWHSWSVIVQQWVQSDVTLGWNPYWGAGQPLALNNNLFCYLPTVAFTYLFGLLGINLPPTIFFNLVFLFGYFNVCTGGLLLFRLLYKNNFFCMLGFAAILFGGLLYAEAHETGINALSFMPYLLFLLIYFYKTKKPGSLVFFLFVLGLSVNFYLPSIVYLALLTFLALALAAGLKNPGLLREHLTAGGKAIASRPVLVVAGFILFFATAGPFIINYIELQDYVSVTRGFSTDAQSTELSYQEAIGTPLNHYSYLFNYETAKVFGPEESFRVKSHGSFYIGILPTLGILVGLVLGRNWFFIIFSGALVAFGAGIHTPVWEWMGEHVPLANSIRHTFAFARIATLALIIVSLSGFMPLISDKHSFTKKSGAILLATGIIYFLIPGTLSGLQMANLFLGCIALLAISASTSAIQPKAMMVCLPLLIALHCTDLILFSAHQVYFEGRQIKMQEIAYPKKWESLPENLKGMPFDHRPMFNKQAIWSNRIPNYISMLQSDFAQFLLHNNLLVKRNPQMLGTRTIPSGLALREIQGDIFNLVPYQEGIDPDQVALQALKHIIGIQKPVLEVAGGSSNTTRIARVLDYDVGTAWQAATNPGSSPPWIAFSIQAGFAPDQLVIWYATDLRTLAKSSVELWLSDDNQTWEFAQKLHKQITPRDKPQDPALYILEKAITHKYFKLVFNGEHPPTLAEVNLMETQPPASMVEANNDLGVIHYTPSHDSNRVELEVTAHTDAYLLRLENFHSGWQARIDGKEAPILKVYPNFQMVRVPAGTHKLAFEFHSHYQSLVNLFVATGFLGGIAFLFWLARLNVGEIYTRIKLHGFFPQKGNIPEPK